MLVKVRFQPHLRVLCTAAVASQTMDISGSWVWSTMARIVRTQQISHTRTGQVKVKLFEMIVVHRHPVSGSGAAGIRRLLRSASSSKSHHVCSCDGDISAPPRDGKRETGHRVASAA